MRTVVAVADIAGRGMAYQYVKTFMQRAFGAGND